MQMHPIILERLRNGSVDPAMDGFEAAGHHHSMASSPPHLKRSHRSSSAHALASLGVRQSVEPARTPNPLSVIALFFGFGVKRWCRFRQIECPFMKGAATQDSRPTMPEAFRAAVAPNVMWSKMNV